MAVSHASSLLPTAVSAAVWGGMWANYLATGKDPLWATDDHVNLHQQTAFIAKHNLLPRALPRPAVARRASNC